MGFLSGFFVSKDSCHAGVKAQAAFAAAFLLFLVMSRPYAYVHLQVVEGFTALLVVAALVAASLMTEGSSGSLSAVTACNGTGFASARSAPHLRRDWARPCHICAGTALTPCHICAGTGLAPATSAPGLGSPSSTSSPGLGCLKQFALALVFGALPSLHPLLLPPLALSSPLAPRRKQRSISVFLFLAQECVSPSTYHGCCSSQYY